jgi:hypothetical protein
MSPRGRHPRPHPIHLYLVDLNQLFNSMDPSPFHERDLDDDAEEFIVSWAQEFPSADPVSLTIHLEKEPPAGAEDLVRQAVHHYFSYRTRITGMEFSRLLKQGRTSLAIGLLFLLGCFTARELMSGLGEGPLASFAREGILIAGWVAMWRPMQIYLYDWWPLGRRQRIFQKLGRMPIELRGQSADPAGAPGQLAAGGPFGESARRED